MEDATGSMVEASTGNRRKYLPDRGGSEPIKHCAYKAFTKFHGGSGSFKSRARNFWKNIRTIEVGIVIGIIALWFDYSGRIEGRTVSAWQLLTEDASGNSGKIEALEYLNSESGICLSFLRGYLAWLNENEMSGCIVLLKPRTVLWGIDLSTEDPETGRTFLSTVDLSDANMMTANLTNALLVGATFSRANLAATKFNNAVLVQADFRYANMMGAELRGANLAFADFSGAILVWAEFHGTDLSDTIGLTQSQLDVVCGDLETTPPEGLEISLCDGL